MDREKWVDSIKGIAIAGVVLIHSTDIDLPAFMMKFVLLGKSGVQLFFMISGFLLWKSLGKIEAAQMNYKGWIKWFLKKVWRLLPLYYLATILYVIITGGSPYWYGTENGISAFNLIAHFSFLHGVFPHYCNSIIGVEWYIGALVLFYIIGPFIYKWIDCLEKAIIFFGASSYICSIVCEKAAEFAKILPDGYIYSNYFTTFCFMSEFPCFVLGIVLFYVSNVEWKDKIHNLKMVSYSIVIFSLVFFRGMAVGSNNMYCLSPNVMFSVCWFFLAWSQIVRPCKIISNTVWGKLGQYSYGIYLFHLLLIPLCNRVLHKMNNDIIRWTIRYILVMVISLLVSIILNRWIEKPLMRIIKK